MRRITLVILGVIITCSFAHAGKGMRGGKKQFEKEPSQKEESLEMRGNISPSGLSASFPVNVVCTPIASPYASSTRYDGSRRPTSRYGGFHGGMDLSLEVGTPLLAVAGGKVVNMGVGGQAEGIYLWLQHPPESTGLPFWVYTKYQHLSELPRYEGGEAVKVGDIIGLSGKTGTTGGHYGSVGYPHLHMTTVYAGNDQYEVKGSKIIPDEGGLFDPLALFLRDITSIEEIQQLSEERKKIQIPYSTGDGVLHPSESPVTWPVSCETQ